MLVVCLSQDTQSVMDYRELPDEDTPVYFTLSSFQNETRDNLMKKLEIVFSSPSCINSSFLAW